MERELATIDEVIKALGGPVAVLRLTGHRSRSSVSNMRAAGQFPPRTYVVMTTALTALGKTAPAHLWGMIEPVDDFTGQGLEAMPGV